MPVLRGVRGRRGGGVVGLWRGVEGLRWLLAGGGIQPVMPPSGAAGSAPKRLKAQAVIT